MSDNKYFAAKESKETADIILNKAHSWFNTLSGNGYLYKLQQLWRFYHGLFESSMSDGHAITFGGEQGELVNIHVNHFRNIAQNMLVMITASRPSLRARATNTDYRSIIQTTLANGLLDYYMREKKIERFTKTAVEYAIVLGAGYIKMDWDQNAGEIYDYIGQEIDEDTGEVINPGIPMYEGDVILKNLTPFDVVFDNSRTDQNHNWVVTRSFESRFDLIAKYPELEEKILGLPSKKDLYAYSIDFRVDETDLVPVYEFYHKSTPAMPNGRYMIFLSSDVILYDDDMPYRELPVYRISPSDIIGTPYGYTPMFDLLPIQEAMDSIYSSILTNQNAFGVQNIWIPEGSDMNFVGLEGGLNVIESKVKPEPLQLTATSPESFKYLELLTRDLELLSGVNSVARGNPEASLKSGSALALVQSQALQFMSGLQQSYISLLEDVGTGLINMLRDFATSPRIAAIAGKDNKTEMKEFNGDDLHLINRVLVDVGNPLQQTAAGKIQMADNLLQYLGNKGGFTAENYLTVLNTGNLNTFTDQLQSKLNIIRLENERLVENSPVVSVYTDDHLNHIIQHSSILDDPELRFDIDLANRVQDHIEEHIELLRNIDPELLKMLGQQPLGPVGGTPANQPPPGAEINQSAGGVPPEMMQNPQEQASQPMEQAGQPNIPAAPAIPSFGGQG